MSRISFDEVMDFYPKHNRSVFDMIVTAQKSGTLIPFVGAGLSVFCGYKLWGAVLNELAEYIPAEDARCGTALGQIREFAYEEAAQSIFDAYPYMLDQLPQIVSPERFETCPPEVLRASASYILPFLFGHGLAITTNFDRVLEKIFFQHNNTPLDVLTPHQQDRLAQFRQNDALGLFKLHGDIGSTSIDLDDLVFTGKQYDEKYADDGPLVLELKRYFENRKLLFLGCSLNVDRTMEVLKQVALSQRSIQHFAILGCKKADIPHRMAELGHYRILPIFYDDSDHDAVRVVLERLLEETDSASYKKLCSEHKTTPIVTKEERRLLFDADYFPFTGRETELQSLNDFCDSEDTISWWAVTGPGGMGKSRLVYEFANQKSEEGWRTERFEASPSKYSDSTRLEDLDVWAPRAQRTIVVLDDVQAHIDRVMKWVARIVHQPRSEKLRILLLEREGEDIKSSPWLATVHSDDISDEWCFNERFLILKPMPDEELCKIMVGFADAAGKHLNAELLLKTLERVDPKLKRPLYAIAIADARCQGKDPTNWDRKTVLDTLLDRELDFHFNRFKGLTGCNASKTIKSELTELLARSCINSFLQVEDVEIERYPKLQKRMNEADMDKQEFLEGLGIVRTLEFESIEIDQAGNVIGEPSSKREDVILLSCPDLIKEHLVLNQVLEWGKIDLLLPQEWEEDPGKISFLIKLLSDYSDRLMKKSDFWERVFNANPQMLFPARFYGFLIWGYAYFYPKDVRKAVDRLSLLYDSMDEDSEIAEYYANGLLIMSARDDYHQTKEAADILERLFQHHSNQPEIVILYAKALLNLLSIPNSEGHIDTISRLEELYHRYSDNSSLAEYYAKGLRLLLSAQDLVERTKTVACLRELMHDHPDNQELIKDYACGLAALSCAQDFKGCLETNACLDELYLNHSNSPEVVFWHAFGLEVSARFQDLESHTKTLAQIWELYRNHPENRSTNYDLLSIYSRGLGKLSDKQDLKNRTETIIRLRELFRDNPCHVGVAKALSGSQVNLAFHQQCEVEIRDTITWSRSILAQHPADKEIQLDYVKTMFNLTLKQCEEDIPSTVAEIVDYLHSHKAIIPEFKEALDVYLADHPVHKERYQPFQELD